jgi:ribosome biogenesis protein BRX1
MTTTSSAASSSSLASAALEALAGLDDDARGPLRGPENAREACVASAGDTMASPVARPAVLRRYSWLRLSTRTAVISVRRRFVFFEVSEHRPSKAVGGGGAAGTPSRTMKNKKKLRQKQEEAEAIARGERAEVSSSEESESEEEAEAAAAAARKGKKRKQAAADDGDASEEEIEDNRDRPRPKVDFTGVNAKEKCLILSSRGVTSRYRHLMLDIGTLIPHSKKDSKLDTKNPRDAVVEVADMKSCSSAMFFECRKRTDCYMWLAKVPEGPSVKFHVENVHTMAELKLTGNHLKFSRPALHFDASFDDTQTSPHLTHIKEMLTHVFTTPYKHHKMKPFLDHVFAFYWEDNRVWFRNYQISYPEGKEARGVGATLVETGPRLCLHPIKIFAGAFGGPTLYDDPTYVSPNVVRREEKKKDQGKYQRKVEKKAERKAHARMNALKPDELDGWLKD